jgi:hypothetical protein
VATLDCGAHARGQLDRLLGLLPREIDIRPSKLAARPGQRQPAWRRIFHEETVQLSNIYRWVVRGDQLPMGMKRPSNYPPSVLLTRSSAGTSVNFACAHDPTGVSFRQNPFAMISPAQGQWTVDAFLFGIARSWYAPATVYPLPFKCPLPLKQPDPSAVFRSAEPSRF